MKTINEVIQAIEACTAPGGTECERCAYNGQRDCQDAIDLDALEILKKHRRLMLRIRAKREEATA